MNNEVPLRVQPSRSSTTKPRRVDVLETGNESRKYDTKKCAWSFALPALLALVLARRGSITSSSVAQISDAFSDRLRSFDIPASLSNFPTTYAAYVPSLTTYSPVLQFPSHSKADTTAILLNWSRLGNVLLISSLLCGPWLEDTIAEIFVWNNNPKVTLTIEDFGGTGCSPARLRIYNSPENLLFQARYLACAKSRTAFCFTQDDDYLIRPELIRTMRSYFQNSTAYSLHLQPPHEHLSPLRSFTSKDGSIMTSFAWLGYGTYLRRSSVIQFLDLLRALNATEEEMNMADNYFTILANRPKEDEIWFDHAIELGGDQPFTVGSEGEERNNKHIVRALQYLSSLVTGPHSASNYPCASSPDPLKKPQLANFAPCRIGQCVLISNIDLFPTIDHSRNQDENLQTTAERGLHALHEIEKERCIYHPLSNAVDSCPSSSFLSRKSAKLGDWIILDALGTVTVDTKHRKLELALLVESEVEFMFMGKISFSTSVDAKKWAEVQGLNCVKAQPKECAARLVECSVEAKAPARYFRLMLSGSDSESIEWSVYEIWLRYLSK